MFCETTAASLGGYYDPELWSRIIQQASIGVSSIRHVVIALAALDLTAASQRSSRSSVDGLKSDAFRRHEFALRQYSRAIKEMREDLSSTKQDMRTTLISTILIVCFEAYHGNYEAALAQFRTGYQVFDEWKATQTYMLDDGLSSPAPFLVEDQVVRTLYQLEIQVMTHTDTLSLDAHKRLKESGASALAKMPQVFQTVTDALIYGKLVMRRCVHFMAMSWVYDDGNSAAPSASFSLFDRVTACTNPEAFREQDRYLGALRRWHEAFLPVLERARTPLGQKDFFAATCLQMHYLVTYVSVLSALASSELFYDSLNAMFAEIVSLSKIILETSQKPNFTCAFRVVFPLDLVAKKCRDPVIRREAIQLLLAKPRRELFWDSFTAAKVCLWVVKIEEEGMVGDYVSEEMRVRNIGVTFSTDEQKLFISCKQGKRGSKDVTVREAVIVL